jgi:hypothetical protein
MDDQLDNDLRNHIRDVFENYDDKHADEGWLLLREKYPEKTKRGIVIWLRWGVVAASLLLVMGILWYKYTPQSTQKIKLAKNQHPKHLAPEGKKIKDQPNNENEDIQADSVINSLKKQMLANNSSHPGRYAKNTVRLSNRQSLVNEIADQKNKSRKAGKNEGNNPDSFDETKNENEAVVVAKSQANQVLAESKAGKNLNKPGTTTTADSANTTGNLAAVAKPAPGINMQEETKKAKKTLFADEEPPVKKNEKTDNGKRGVRFGIYEATYVNYAKGSNNQVNVGAGVSSDIKLSKKLNLSTGISIAQNTLNYGSQLPPPVSAKLAASATSNGILPAAAAQNRFAAATPSLSNYNASLVGLDVPINLKYEFNPQKTSAYISLGVSSGTFINETYTSSYHYVTPFASNLSQNTDESIHQSFNSFYFAKTLNFSFGTGYALGKNKLIIEPFLKYPLEGLGSQQIKFGAGGINLKFNFRTQK